MDCRTCPQIELHADYQLGPAQRTEQQGRECEMIRALLEDAFELAVLGVFLWTIFVLAVAFSG
jgi:hypothetical protein